MVQHCLLLAMRRGAKFCLMYAIQRETSHRTEPLCKSHTTSSIQLLSTTTCMETAHKLTSPVRLWRCCSLMVQCHLIIAMCRGTKFCLMYAIHRETSCRTEPLCTLHKASSTPQPSFRNLLSSVADLSCSTSPSMLTLLSDALCIQGT